MIAPYRKAIVAAVGAGVIILNQFAGSAIDPDAVNSNVGSIIDSVVALLVMFGVYQVRNETNA